MKRTARTEQGTILGCSVYLVVSTVVTVISLHIGAISEYRFPFPITTAALHSAMATVAARLFGRIVGRSIRHRKDRLTDGLGLSGYAASLATLAEIILAGQEQDHNRVLIGSLVLLCTFRSFPFRSLQLSAAARTVCCSGIALAVGLLASQFSASLLPGVSCILNLVAWSILAAEFDAIGPRLTSLTFLDLIIQHLQTATLLSILAAAFSSEHRKIIASSSTRFFSEPMFWLQTIAMSLCGLLNLGAFAWLLQSVHPWIVPPTALLKHRIVVPLALHWRFGNALELGWTDSLTVVLYLVLIAVGLHRRSR